MSEFEEKTNPVIEIKQIQGNLLSTEKIRLTSVGLKNTGRKANDGVTFFGIKSNINKSEIDFELNLEGDFKDNPNSLIFMVYFRKEEKKFYLKSHKSSIGSISLPIVNIQITQPYVSAN